MELQQAPIEIAHLGSSIWSYRRRMIGAILIETRPDRMIRSAWRGEARRASKPKRGMSTRDPAIAVISIAQQASPKVIGNRLLERAQFRARSSVVVSTR